MAASGASNFRAHPARDAWANRRVRCITNHRHNITMPARIRPKDAKPILCIVVGYPPDIAREGAMIVPQDIKPKQTVRQDFRQ